MIFPRVHYAFAEFRGGGRRFGPPLNTPLDRVEWHCMAGVTYALSSAQPL